MRLSRDGLIAAYHDYGRPRSEWRVGAEFERHLLDGHGRPLPYFGEPGIAWMFQVLIDEDGWEPTVEHEHVIALSKGGARITLEPGGQFELSGAPHDGVAGVDAELEAFNHRIDSILAGTGYRQVALGYTPFVQLDAIPWVPKGRYAVMREHLGKTGSLAHNMMKGTCATQASYDFSNEADCAEMVGLATKIGPLTTAMFANSPMLEGKDTGYASFRGHIWTQTDPRRTGFPEAADQFTFERWVDYLLQVPMMFFRRGHDYLPAKGRTFADWLEDADNPPNWDDWELHLTSVFPEVRIKRTIEVRGADCVPRPLAMSFTALFVGLFYDTQARHDAIALAERFTSGSTADERFAIACRGGLSGKLGERTLADWAQDLVQIGAAGVERWNPADARFLQPLIRQIDSGESPSASVCRSWRASSDIGSFLEAHHVEG